MFISLIYFYQVQALFVLVQKKLSKSQIICWATDSENNRKKTKQAD